VSIGSDLIDWPDDLERLKLKHVALRSVQKRIAVQDQAVDLVE
jgi:hypothetical protein